MKIDKYCALCYTFTMFRLLETVVFTFVWQAVSKIRVLWFILRGQKSTRSAKVTIIVTTPISFRIAVHCPCSKFRIKIHKRRRFFSSFHSFFWLAEFARKKFMSVSRFFPYFFSVSYPSLYLLNMHKNAPWHLTQNCSVFNFLLHRSQNVLSTRQIYSHPELLFLFFRNSTWSS